MHLEGGQNVTSGDIQLSSLRGFVAQKRQLLLEPGDAWQVAGVQCLLPGYGPGVWPDAKASVGQALPGKQRAWIQLAQGRDIAVANDVARVDLIAG